MCIYIYIYIHTYICIYIYTHTYTYIYVYIPRVQTASDHGLQGWTHTLNTVRDP